VTDKISTVYYRDKKEAFVNVVYFRLSDTSELALTKFLEECKTHLSGLRDQKDFSIGQRALQIRNSDSAPKYDIAVRMVFNDFTAYEKYRNSRKPQDFVTATAGMISDKATYNYFLF